MVGDIAAKQMGWLGFYRFWSFFRVAVEGSGRFFNSRRSNASHLRLSLLRRRRRVVRACLTAFVCCSNYSTCWNWLTVVVLSMVRVFDAAVFRPRPRREMVGVWWLFFLHRVCCCCSFGSSSRQVLVRVLSTVARATRTTVVRAGFCVTTKSTFCACGAYFYLW